MTHPNMAAAPQPQRGPNGFVQMGGGYEASIAAANGQQAPQHLTQLGQPTPQALPPQPMIQPNNWTPPVPQQVAQPTQIPGGLPNMQMPQGGQPAPQHGLPFQPPVPLSPTQPAVQPNNGGAGSILGERLVGANIPPEYQGRTVQEVIAMNQGLRQMHLNSLTQQPQRSMAPAPQQPQQTQQQPIGGQMPGSSPVFDWRNPTPQIEQAATNAVREVMQKEVLPVMQPVIQQNMLQAAKTAADQVRAEIGPQKFAQLEPLIYQQLQGVDPQYLLNPQTWKTAAHVAAGQMALAPQQQMPMQPVYQPQGGYPVQQLNQMQQPLPNLNTFFTEQGGMGGRVQPPMQLSPEQKQAAALLQMSEADYAAWAGGGR